MNGSMMIGLMFPKIFYLNYLNFGKGDVEIQVVRINKLFFQNSQKKGLFSSHDDIKEERVNIAPIKGRRSPGVNGRVMMLIISSQSYLKTWMEQNLGK
jgi:hypothetical protein